MSDCCNHNKDKKAKPDILLWGSISIILVAYILHLLPIAQQGNFSIFTHSAFELINKMWWGIALGVFFVGVLDKIPREFVISIFGNQDGIGGILRATMAGVALDLCSHGILLVGMKLYERGISLAQLMAFLIASPWNSISLTLILWSLIGFKWMMTFLLLSLVIAIISGLIFQKLEAKNILPKNPNKVDLPDGFNLRKEFKSLFKLSDIKVKSFFGVFAAGAKSSKMILRWIFFGVVIATVIRTFVPLDIFQQYFGPTLVGLGLTIIAATIIEVCSEGSVPIASDLITRAAAPGNSFAFLMAGVSTDYTEIMSLKETTGSWKIAFFLPLVTLPQIIFLGFILNSFVGAG